MEIDDEDIMRRGGAQGDAVGGSFRSSGTDLDAALGAAESATQGMRGGSLYDLGASINDGTATPQDVEAAFRAAGGSEVGDAAGWGRTLGAGVGAANGWRGGEGVERDPIWSRGWSGGSGELSAYSREIRGIADGLLSEARRVGAKIEAMRPTEGQRAAAAREAAEARTVSLMADGRVGFGRAALPPEQRSVYFDAASGSAPGGMSGDRTAFEEDLNGFFS